jgi:cytidyltransferase-like protein
MSGINHLYDLYNKKGQEFVDHLFNTFVTVNEKMDGSAFTFERDKETGKFKFFRRDQRNPITFVDRTLMKYYEKPIQYIESLPPNILEKIPRGWRFGLEYFANNKPVEIMYDRVPKNHLILSYVHEYGDDGKIKKTIQDKGELDNWADLLGIERAPIIFQGYLTDEQKDSILTFLRTPFEKLVERFKTQSFVRFIIGVLNPELKKSALNEDLDKDVEGIVFRFGDPGKEVSEPVLAKMVDPVFTQMAKEKTQKQREDKPSDFLGLTLLDVMNFILEKGVDRFKVEGDTEDERYVSFMGDVFSNFLEEYAEKYRGADFEEPEYLKREEFRLNKDLIEDRRVLKYVNEDDSFESLFKLMLNSFRKIKSRAGGIITKGMMEQMNLLVREIKDYIQKPRKGKLHEGFLSFLDFKKEISPEVEYLKEEDSETEADENPFYSYKEFISTLETIDSSPSPKKEVLEKEEGKEGPLKEVNLLMGRFQPFHNGHLKMAKVLKEKNDLPSVIAVVNPGHNKSGKTPFSADTVEKFMKGIIQDEKDIVDFIIVPRGLIGSSIVKLLAKGYRVNLVGAGEDRVDDYAKQIEYVKRSDIKDQMQDLQLVKTPRVTSATEVRQAIKDEDYQKFRKLVPPAVEKMYSALKSEMNPNTNESKVLVEHMSLDFDQLLLEAGTPDQQGKIRNGLFNLRQYLANLKLSPSLSGEDERNLEKILDLINVINNLSKGVVKGKSPLKSVISSLILGSGGDKKSIAKKEDLVEDLIADMEESTIDNLISRYVSKSTSFPIVTLKDIINNLGGRFSFNPQQDFNGISPRDIKKIYRVDPKIPSGNQQRGKGESLFSIAFDSPKNAGFGGDVDSPELDKVVEIKSTNNAGISPDLEQSSGRLTSSVFSNFLDLAHKLFPSVTDLGDGKIQKTSSTQLIQEMKEDNTKNGINGGNGPKTQQLLDYLNRMVPKGSGEEQVKNIQIDDVIPLLLLFQIDHYSYRCKNFKALAVFVEVDGSPEEMVLIECFPYEEGENFVTQKNLNTVKNAGLAAKITSKRPEIYKP